MSSALFSLIDLDAPDRLPGCRLQRLELFNWGTFDKHVWVFDLGGRNALLTGEIGSGKSTLVDAVTTLLLPAQKISYNRAAGADTRERDLRSYVEGHYKSERNETTGASRSVGLRDARHFCVLLGIFANLDYGTTVTLAQVFRAREPGQPGQPDRFFVVADADLSISTHFSDFGAEISGLKRRLRDTGARTYDSFPDYGKDFRRKLGIESEQAMELFHQTVSMKAVDNLNDFVRSHMLEPFDTKATVGSLIEHFDNLTRAHEAVVRARHQLELLSPIMVDLGTYEDLAEKLAQTASQREALPYFFAQLTVELCSAQLAEIEQRLARINSQLEARGSRLEALRAHETQLSIEIAGSGGARLAAIDEEAGRLEKEKPLRQEKLRKFNQRLSTVGLGQVANDAQFSSVKGQVAQRRAELDAERAGAQNALTEHLVDLRGVEDESKDVNTELLSLQSRPTNIPSASLTLRARLCTDIGVDGDDLPFAGELVQVRPEASGWEGAAERVLHNFALSLLVPNRHYELVASWVNEHHLGTRLVYFRVPSASVVPPAPDRRDGHPLLVDMLEVKPASAFAPWLSAELARRANHACVDAIADLRSAAKAVTRAGQVKDQDRHEKDDRRSITDRREYVLGWSNEQKIDAMVKHAQALHVRQSQLSDDVGALKETLAKVSGLLEALGGLEDYGRWEELDWEALVARVADLSGERERLLAGSGRLSSLNEELARARAEIATEDGEAKRLEREKGGAESEQGGTRAQLAKSREVLSGPAAAQVATSVLEAIGKRALDDLSYPAIDLANVAAAHSELGALLGREESMVVTQQGTVSRRLVASMSGFRSQYPQETLEMDASVEAGPEYRQLHQRLAEDDLPRFEKEFKDYLNQNTVREIAGLSAQLHKQETLIRERVETINNSLVEIDYNDGRYIRLVPDQTTNVDVREFRTQLRACTDDIIGGQGEQYSEQKFLQVKQIIDRFKGREGMTELDRNWTRRVTDVRQWFVFSASERYRDDDREYEHYTDSAGKSGGQKEKLAYTVLAASLAYQFKLDWGAARSKAFRFVVIDEAFSRGSEISTRYALSLFTRLGLQLLIVTPLQKIHVIEPHVSAVGFVDNPTGSYSRLQSLSIAEYRRRREQRSGGLENGLSAGEPGPGRPGVAGTGTAGTGTGGTGTGGTGTGGTGTGGTGTGGTGAGLAGPAA